MKFPYGLAVRIPGFHPGGPGSTPGMGITMSFSFSFFLFVIINSFLIYQKENHQPEF